MYHTFPGMCVRVTFGYKLRPQAHFLSKGFFLFLGMCMCVCVRHMTSMASEEDFLVRKLWCPGNPMIFSIGFNTTSTKQNWKGYKEFARLENEFQWEKALFSQCPFTVSQHLFNISTDIFQTSFMSRWESLGWYLHDWFQHLWKVNWFIVSTLPRNKREGDKAFPLKLISTSPNHLNSRFISFLLSKEKVANPAPWNSLAPLQNILLNTPDIALGHCNIKLSSPAGSHVISHCPRIYYIYVSAFWRLGDNYLFCCCRDQNEGQLQQRPYVSAQCWILSLCCWIETPEIAYGLEIDPPAERGSVLSALRPAYIPIYDDNDDDATWLNNLILTTPFLLDWG